MPVIIKPGPGSQSGTSRDRTTSSPFSLLSTASPTHNLYHILRSSFRDRHSARPPPSIAPDKNGFAHTVIRAWQQDLHLRLRPDDVWLAILTQFSFFVNRNAEALRPIFVAHEGQEKLIVEVDATIGTVHLGIVAQRLAAMAKKRLVDPDIATTLLPTFTTTTPHDRAVASMVFMGVVSKYFASGIRFGCGFPSVTLLGERGDWADMLERVAWFGTLGHEEANSWTIRLTKVLEYMVASFDSPDGAIVKDFWARAVHEATGSMSGGMVTLSGWLTAFCWWEGSGERLRGYTDEELARRHVAGYRRLTLDDVEFPVIERKKVPPAVVAVPVTLYHTEESKAILVAGSMGMQVTEEGEGQTVAQPASGWWLLADREEIFGRPQRTKEEIEEAEKKRPRGDMTPGEPTKIYVKHPEGNEASARGRRR
ncbi:hypothetical protein F5144DRAFT_370571 [Chaetomium tenue]|uniref:Uncharacterized protein n=1 Tax=Chaetomium tenue TaxID=1854479 RepID=A0ACB7NZC1_9PEZI|nr:hypothetical protein F5144DRAFT_370571 [Chaetomium globosum]